MALTEDSPPDGYDVVGGDGASWPRLGCRAAGAQFAVPPSERLAVVVEGAVADLLDELLQFVE
ncbi:hypothetical protein GCM10023107_74900 [Actinoplanes octamycinicus]